MTNESVEHRVELRGPRRSRSGPSQRGTRQLQRVVVRLLEAMLSPSLARRNDTLRFGKTHAACEATTRVRYPHAIAGMVHAPAEQDGLRPIRETDGIGEIGGQLVTRRSAMRPDHRDLDWKSLRAEEVALPPRP